MTQRDPGSRAGWLPSIIDKEADEKKDVISFARVLVRLLDLVVGHNADRCLAFIEIFQTVVLDYFALFNLGAGHTVLHIDILRVDLALWLTEGDYAEKVVCNVFLSELDLRYLV